MKKISYIILTLVLILGIAGLAKSSWAATINVVSQIDGSPSCDNGTNHNGVESAELSPTQPFVNGNWAKGAGWTVSGGNIVYSGSAPATMQPAISPTFTTGTGYKYYIWITATVTSGTFTATFGGQPVNWSPAVTYSDGASHTYWAYVTPTTSGNFIITSPSGSAGVTITAMSIKLVRDDVDQAVASAGTGDTVSVPAGSCTWSWAVGLSKQIKFIGAGIGNTNITCPSGRCINATGLSNSDATNIRVSGLSFGANPGGNGAVYLEGVDWRIDHNSFSSTNFGVAMLVDSQVRGVFSRGLIDNNIFTNLNAAVNYGSALFTGWDQTDVLWTQNPGLGDQNAVYVEHNTINTSVYGDAMDANSGARMVFRFNTLTNNGPTNSSYGFWLAVHSKGGLGQRGTQRWEVYGNTLDGKDVSVYVPMNLRAGTGVAFNNTVKGTWTSYIIGLDNIRSITAEPCSDFGCCDGTDPRDQNTPNENGYACRDQIGIGQDTTLWCNGTQTADGCSAGTYGAWNQIKMPVYEWNNGPQTTCTTGGTCDNSLQFRQFNNDVGNPIQANRDFYNYISPFTGASGVGVGTLANRPSTCTAGVGYWATDQGSWNNSGSGGQGVLYKCTATNTWTLYYTPYTYPHPLQGGGQPSVLYGDVSGDGQVSAYDAALTAQAAVGLITFTSDKIKAGDVDGNGTITAYDAALIAQKVVGLINKFPVES